MNSHAAHAVHTTANGSRKSGIYRNLVGGVWMEGEATVWNINPSDTNDVIGEYTQANENQVNSACAAAGAAFPRWSGQTAQYRADVLDFIGTRILEQHEVLGTLLAREEGKPVRVNSTLP